MKLLKIICLIVVWLVCRVVMKLCLFFVVKVLFLRMFGVN